MQIHQSAEDYLEAILILKNQKGAVRSIDIAVHMNYSKPSISRAVSLLRENGAGNVRLILDGHERFEDYLEPGEMISGGLFNLGFLPGGDRALTTRCEATLAAVSGAVRRLKDGGVLGVAVYPGHPEGEREGEALGALLSALPKTVCDVFLYRIVNVPDAPFLYVVEKRG